MSTVEKIEKAVVEGYKKIEEGVVEGYKYIENGVVDSFNEVVDGFVEKHLVKEGETVEEARVRLAEEQEKRQSNTKAHGAGYDHKATMEAQQEMIAKSIEASKNAGKR